MATPSISISPQKPKAGRECAVLNIDVRSATKLSNRSTRDSLDEAKRLLVLVELFRRETNGCSPNFVKSTGDGIMCVWHLYSKDRQSTLKNVVELALKLNANLSKDLCNKLQDTPLKLGFGLTYGYVAEAKVWEKTDYFGHTANLAAKLQDSARPSGLVIDGEYIKTLKESKLTNNALTEHDATAALAAYGVKTCYCTDEVEWKTDWTCVAWPGFASRRPGEDKDSKEQHKFGLNAKGVTVLTHEGLRGKIGTLEIWQRHTLQARGDCFEIIIDDFDALAAMYDEKTLGLKSLYDLGEAEAMQVFDKICPALTESEENNEPFLFVPIRCGINSIVWNSSAVPDFSTLRRYSEIRDLIKAKKIKPHQIGLYDNIGATLPLIGLMMEDVPQDATVKELYNLLWNNESALSHVYDRFADLLGSALPENSPNRFSLYTKAERLSNALHAGSISAALGGGGWLIQPKKQTKNLLLTGLPSVHGGLLWVEGAAITSRTGHGAEILKFFSEHVLEDKYQASLATRTPYSSCPVTIKVIGDTLSSQTAPRPIDVETRTIFKNTDQINELLVHRQRPKNMALWSDLWKRIVLDYCQRCDRA